MDPSTLTKRIARIRWEFTWLLRPRQAGLHRYLRNSHGSVDVDKEDCTDTWEFAWIAEPLYKQDCADTPGIHMQSATSNSQGTSAESKIHGYSQETFENVVRQGFYPIHLQGHVLSCKTQHFVHRLSLKNAFRARLPSKTES
jgi:hypothetical protein